MPVYVRVGGTLIQELGVVVLGSRLRYQKLK